MKEHVIINPDRTVNVPESMKKIGIQYDHNVKTITFDCPRYPDEDPSVDMSTMKIFINWMLPDKKLGSTIATNVCVDSENENLMHFDWVITKAVTPVSGVLSTLICIKETTETGEETYHWNTELIQSFKIGNGMECTEQIVEQNIDVITQLLVQMDAVNTRTSEEALERHVETYLTENPPTFSDQQADEGVRNYMEENAQTHVDNYLERNPLELDETLTDSTKAAPADLVGELKGDLEQLKQNGTGTGTGLSTDAIDKLEEVGNYLAYTTADGGSKWTELISILRNGSSGSGSGETDVTLSSISATYNGGDVPVGTALNSLTGITVTGTYSNGSTSEITGYTLSGTIAEGNNTITVSYGGKTTTFTVVGYVEEEEPDTPSTDNTEPVYELAQATTFDGTNYVDTGYVLNDVDKDFSILVEYVASESTYNSRVFDASKNANSLGPFLREDAGCIGVGNTGFSEPFVKVGRTYKRVITHKKDSGVFNVYNINDDVNFRYDGTITYSAYATNQHTIGNTLPLTLGKLAYKDGCYFKGTIYHFEIHERVITDEEIDTFIGATWEAPSEPTNLIDINTCTLGGSMPDGRQVSTDYYITDFIPIVSGNPYYTNITKYIDESTTDGGQYIYSYIENKTWKSQSQNFVSSPMGTNNNFTQNILSIEGLTYIRLVFHKNYKDIAFFGEGLV